MTYAITLIKGETAKREQTLSLLMDLKEQKDLLGNGVYIKEIFISFGWPDFVLLLRGNNVELLKDSIVKIRDLVYNGEPNDNLETSTIICMTLDEIEDAKAIAKRLGKK